MERESLVPARCIRVPTSVAERGAQGEVALDLPECQRGFILHEIYARADLARVEPEDVAFVIHNEPYGEDNSPLHISMKSSVSERP
jgi:hypothetical protein